MQLQAFDVTLLAPSNSTTNQSLYLKITVMDGTRCKDKKWIPQKFPIMSLRDDILIKKLIRDSHHKYTIPQYLVLNFVPV